MSSRPRPQTESERYYKCSSIDKARLLPSIFDEPPKYTYSIIVPAYNETKRMPSMLEETIEYLEERKNSDRTFSYEIIVVDDASDDGTGNVALEFSKSKKIELKVLTLEKNRKKGGAVTQVFIIYYREKEEISNSLFVKINVEWSFLFLGDIVC